MNSNIYLTSQLIENSSPYVNESFPTNNHIPDDFYCMPRQEDHPICDTYNTIVNSNENKSPSTPPNAFDNGHIYSSPPIFSKNFVIESNLSFDDSQDIPNVSLDSVPDLINDIPTTNDVYYSYPESQIITVSKVSLVVYFLILTLSFRVNKNLYRQVIDCDFTW